MPIRNVCKSIDVPAIPGFDIVTPDVFRFTRIAGSANQVKLRNSEDVRRFKGEDRPNPFNYFEETVLPILKSRME